MKTPVMCQRRPAGITLGTALLAVGAALTGACADGDAPVLAGPVALPGDPAAQVVVLDMDVLTSLESAARQARRGHGAPGEAEPVLYLVRSSRPADAAHLAHDLARQGFDPVIALGATPIDAVRVATP